VAASLSNLAGEYGELGRVDEAIAMQRQALAMMRRVHGPEHPHVATMANNLALELARTGRWEESLELQRQALEVAERTAPEAPELAAKLTNLGKLLLDVGRLEEAAPLIRRADELARARLPETAFTRLACEANAATLDREEARFHGAAARYRDVIERLRAVLGNGHAAVSRVVSLLADTERLAGRSEVAVELFEDALSAQSGEDTTPLHLSETLGGLGLTLAWQGQDTRGGELLASAIETRSGLAPSPDWTSLELRVGAALLAGRTDEARTLLVELASTLGPEHPRVRWLDTLAARRGLPPRRSPRPAPGDGHPAR
jgi:tetratricopeptide (TPR) repeat protein